MVGRLLGATSVLDGAENGACPGDQFLSPPVYQGRVDTEPAPYLVGGQVPPNRFQGNLGLECLPMNLLNRAMPNSSLLREF